MAGPATEGRCPDLRLRFGRASELINQELRVITNAADGVTKGSQSIVACIARRASVRRPARDGGEHWAFRHDGRWPKALRSRILDPRCRQ